MNLPVTLNPTADREFGAAADWYEEQQLGLGAQFVTAVQEALDRIGSMAERDAIVYRDLRRARVAKFPYNIYYRVLADRIDVQSIEEQFTAIGVAAGERLSAKFTATMCHGSGIEKAEGVCGGSARISGTRIPVWQFVEARDLGVTEAQLLLD